jgi:hypothetical protein
VVQPDTYFLRLQYAYIQRMQMQHNSKLVDIEKLRDLLWEEQCRPSLRTIHAMKKRRDIPYVKIGRLVFFDVDAVRESLDKRNTVRARI